jgi:REP element-mobilizing transposase RayT
MAKRQQGFQGASFHVPKDCFGGSLLKNSNAKSKRPLESKLPIHLVLRANRGGMRSPKTHLRVNRAVEKTCKRHGVKIYRYANVGNHLHMLIKIPGRSRWAAFIRELTGRIAQEVKAVTGQAGKYWKQRPFTRIVRGWRKAFRLACDYVELNILEAEGFISRRQTQTLKDLRAIWQDG